MSYDDETWLLGADAFQGRLSAALTQANIMPYYIYREFKPMRDTMEFTVFTVVPYKVRMDFEYTGKDVPTIAELVILVREHYNDGLDWVAENHGRPERREIKVIL